MPSNWTYSVVYLTGTVSLTSYCNDTLVTVSGSGEISKAVLLLNAKNGSFITNTNGGNTPIIDQFNKIKITFTDSNGLSFSKIFEVDKFRPIEDNQSGTQLRVELLAQERHVQYINFARQYYFASAYDTLKNMADRYNLSKGTLQPTITKQDDSSFNKLPKWTSNNYDFNFSETPIYDGQKYVIDKLGTSVQNGGAADFFELYYDDDPASTSQIRINAFSSGSLPASPITIQSSLAVNVGESEAEIESISGTNILAWGAIDQGSLPINFSQFRGIQEAIFLYPAWISGEIYPQNAIVQYDAGSGNNLYKSLINNNTTTPNALLNWTILQPYDLLGSLQYSPWTDNKSGPFKNSGSNPTNSGGFGRGCWDSNLVIYDGTYYRTWADTRKNSTATIPANHKMVNDVAAAVLYRGYRVLVDTTLGAVGGDFALNGGLDRFGNAYAKAIVEHNGGQNTGANAYKNWDCIVTTTNPAKGSALVLGNDNQCAVIDQGKNYRYTGGAWADDSATSIGNDCFHTYTALTNDQGVDQTLTSGGIITYGATSAINVTYQYFPWDPIVNNSRTTSNYYMIGAWLNFRLPYPSTKDNGISEQVGGLYGGNGKSSPEPVTIDSMNLNYTPAGNVGFNASDSEALGPLSALGFMIKLQWLDRIGAKMLEGNFKMRVALYDTFGNVAVQDFVIPFNDMWEDIQLPLNSFKIYRARSPLRWGAISAIIPLQELNILNVFQWRYVKQCCIQLQEVYDDQGRYFPEGSRISINVLTSGTGKASLSMWLDSFRFVKPLLASSGTVSDRNLEPNFLQRQNISNYQQLKADVLSMKQIYNFRHKQFDISTTGSCDINFGDSFYYSNPRIISDADNGANTIKLVAKKIVYHISKTPGGPGGFIRTISGVKRFS